MKPAEIREKTEADLAKQEVKLRQELAALRIQARAGQLAETSKLDAMKRDIARILTIRKEKANQPVAASQPAAEGKAKKK